MTFIKNILKTEEEARALISKAGDEAKQSILREQETQKKDTEEAMDALKTSRAEQIAEQKSKLVDLYKEELAKGQKDMSRIQKKAGANHEKAVLEVLKSITS